MQCGNRYETSSPLMVVPHPTSDLFKSGSLLPDRMILWLLWNGHSDNIQQIAASINRLVGVAQQSQQTQEIQMLHICRKELEDTIEYLEASSMEMEMKSCDETGTKKKLLGKALLKKKKDLKMRQNELAQTKRLTERHHQEGTPSVTQDSMPRFVGIAQDTNNELDDDN